MSIRENRSIQQAPQINASRGTRSENEKEEEIRRRGKMEEGRRGRGEEGKGRREREGGG